MSLTFPIGEYRRLLGTYLRPQRGRVTILALLLLASVALQLISPQIVRYFIDATQRPAEASLLIYLGIAFIGVSLAGRLVTIGTTYLSIDVGWRATNSLRAGLTEHLVRLDMPFHKTHTPGELIERVDGDITELADFFSLFAIRVVTSALLMLGVLVLLSIENWLAGTALALYTAISIAAIASLQGLGLHRWTAVRQAAAEQFGYIEERISAVEDIQGSGAVAYALSKYFPFALRVLAARRSAEMVEYISAGIGRLLFGVGWGLGLGVGAHLYSQGAITIGTVFLIIAYISMLAGPLEGLRKEASNLQRATAGIARIAELFRKTPGVRTNERHQGSLPPGALAVRFDRVTFAYADTEPASSEMEDQEAGLVLRDVSFSLPPGRVLGVLGRTGSGKTTITRLLFRLYDPTSGAVRLGAQDIRQVGLDDLRARVGMVTQDVQLFSATLRDNISFFDPAISDEQIASALNSLGLLDWLETMPHGLDTRLAAGGAGMSAGEAQLLAFTRLLLKDPGLVILDEAASRLDPITERRLEKAIARLLRGDGGEGKSDGPGRTAIIIAHRLRTVQRADDILILDQGSVVEYGPRERLAADPTSRFYSLLQTGLEEALV
ncbi:MAG: ABC transporter ATP-binding protein/permease [Chloroflexota bacterium]|nr:ABC transporter ATP-binding protein/permease [Chloroflexota bacterium]